MSVYLEFPTFGEHDDEPYVREKGKNIIDYPSSYTVIDTETTGLDPDFDELIELGAIRVRDGKEVARFSELVRPDSMFNQIDSPEDDGPDACTFKGVRGRFIPSFITELTGITNEMLATARETRAVLADYLAFIGDDVLVGHNVNFDINFIYDAALDEFDKKIKNNFIDTMRISKKLFPALPHHRLRDIAIHYGIDRSHAHRAVSDCEITNQCFTRLMNDAMKQAGSIREFRSSFSHNLRAKDIQSETKEYDVTNPLYGMVVVFTGTLASMQRKDAMQKVADAGGINGDGVTAKTNYLVLGNAEYHRKLEGGKSNKRKKAEQLILKGQDLQIISENVFLEMLESHIDLKENSTKN